MQMVIQLSILNEVVINSYFFYYFSQQALPYIRSTGSGQKGKEETYNCQYTMRHIYDS